MDRALRILVLEDNLIDAELVIDCLKEDGIQFSCLHVDSRESYISAITSEIFDLILSDHSLPGFNSIDALQICRELGSTTPFILITGTVSEEFAVQCMKNGADDYILKSNLSRLPIAVKSALRNRKLQEQRLAQELQLREQNEELVKINRELDSFVYSISHNIRAPLTSVAGLVYLAKDEDSSRDGHFQSYFSMIQTAIRKLDDTLKEILDYSRNMRTDVQLEVLDPQTMVAQCMEEFAYLPHCHTIKTDVVINGQVPCVADAYRIQMILRNLLSNSIKYLDLSKELRTIAIQFDISTSSNKLTVTDNGIGIRSDLLNKAFHMFFRATEKSQGAGLGLFIVKETVEKINGTISINSQFGEYTSICIEWPNYPVGSTEATMVVNSKSQQSYL